jgi:aspartate/methionine/tyrosine aminotransferase
MFSDRTQWNLQENRLSRALAEAKSAGRRILDLTRSNPTECRFKYDEEAILRAFKRRELLQYAPEAHGMLGAREAVACYYAGRGDRVGVDDLVLTSGTSEGYSSIFKLLCNAGDEILIPSPGYPLFDFLADLCDVKLVRYPLLYDHGWQIDFSALKAAASERTRAVVVVHPNNPTGHYASRSEQNELSRFCADRGAAIISDEVFLDFSLGASNAASFCASDQALSFTLSGISKICGLPQMKLAWVAVSGPEQQKRGALARLEVIADAYLSVGTPVQVAAWALLGTRVEFQQQVMSRVRANLSELDMRLVHQPICQRLELSGGWSVVLRVPAFQSNEDLAVRALTSKQVSIHPGHFYDFAQEGFLVASLIVPEQEFAEGIRRLLAHFE